VSIDGSGHLRHDAAAGMEAGVAERSLPMLPAREAAKFARVLIEKYGADALAFAGDRAQRAVDVGDELAVDAWREVIAAAQRLLQRPASA
jgi:hypothetical protein